MTLRPPHAEPSLYLTGCVLLLSALLPAGLPADVGGNSTPMPGKAPPVRSSQSSAEITLSARNPYALVLHLHSKVRTLYGRNDTLFDPRDPMRSFTFLQVQAGTVLLRDNRTGRTWSRRIGDSLPDLPQHILATTVMLDRLHYHYRVVERVTRTESMLVSLKGSLAVLEQEVAAAVPAPPPTASAADSSVVPAEKLRSLNPTLARLTRVKKLDGDTYEMSAAEIIPALKNAGQVVSDLELMISPTLSVQHGLGFRITSALADGILNHQGFSVTNSKIAQVFGIEVGDRILRINKRPVTDPQSAWWVYQEFMIENRHKTEIRVDIGRGDSLLTKTYRVQ